MLRTCKPVLPITAKGLREKAIDLTKLKKFVEEEIHCPQCEYTTTADHCPRCGAEVYYHMEDDHSAAAQR
jgi:rubrerythrin